MAEANDASLEEDFNATVVAALQHTEPAPTKTTTTSTATTPTHHRTTTPHRPPLSRPTTSLRRTPASALRQRTPARIGPSLPLLPGSRPPPKSPHVIRAWETKRATTPGRERRKSARMFLHARERDSPMDILKKLSTNLASTTRPFYLDATPKPTPRVSLVGTPGRRESVVFNYHSDPEGYDDDEDDDDESPPPPPHSRLSLDPDARVDRENDEFTRIPLPRLSTTPGGRSSGRRATNGTGVGDESMNESTLDGDFSIDSIELPRRAPPESYLNRMSFGFKISDQFRDLDELGGAEDSIINGYENYHTQGGDESVVDGDESSMNIWDLGDNTRDLSWGFLPEERDDTGEVNLAVGSTGLNGLDAEMDFQLHIPQLTESDDGGEEARDEMDIDVDLTESETVAGNMKLIGEDEFGLGSPTQEDPPYFLEDGDEDDNEDEGFPDNETPIAETEEFTSTSRAKKSVTEPQIKTRKQAKELKLSRHGLPVPSLPSRLLKKLASNFAGGRTISNETLAQIMKASDAFFENASVRLGEYAEHAGRKTITESDVELLMKRQRQINSQNTVFSLAEKYLPRELLQEIRMPAPSKGAGVKKRASVARVRKGKGKTKTGTELDEVLEEEEV